MRDCLVDKGSGVQTWSNGAWGTCQATQCIGSYTPLGEGCWDDIGLTRNFASFLTRCWKDNRITCPLTTPMGYIGVPLAAAGNSTTTFSFPILYAGNPTVTLNPSQVLLAGPGATGCSKSVTGEGTARTVSLSGCTGNGSLTLSIASGSAISDSGVTVPSFGPSTAVLVANALPDIPYTSVLDLSYGPGAAQKYDIHFPTDYQQRSGIPIFVWIHGGGWTGGSKELDTGLVQEVARMGFIAINANYTLAPPVDIQTVPVPQIPPVPYSAGMTDIQALINLIIASAPSMNADAAKISIAGGSAGGHLALYQATSTFNSTQFRCVISAAGPTDLALVWNDQSYLVSRWIVGSVFGDQSAVQASVSPASHATAFRGDHLLLVHEIEDNLVPIDQALQMASRIREQKPSVDLDLNYHRDPNPNPLFNPAPSQVTHVFPPDALNSPIKAYLNSKCR